MSKLNFEFLKNNLNTNNNITNNFKFKNQNKQIRLLKIKDNNELFKHVNNNNTKTKTETSNKACNITNGGKFAQNYDFNIKDILKDKKYKFDPKIIGKIYF